MAQNMVQQQTHHTNYHHHHPTEIWWKWVNWMHLAQARDQWWALLNTVMNLRVP
jgi:hypothetical protein